MSRRPHARRAFAAILLIAALAVSAGLLLILTRQAAAELQRERLAGLAAVAEQVLASAWAWARQHPGEIGPGEFVLPVEDLLPAGVQARVELRRSGPENALVTCRLVVERANRRLRQEVHWPMTPPDRG